MCKYMRSWEAHPDGKLSRGCVSQLLFWWFGGFGSVEERMRSTPGVFRVHGGVREQGGRYGCKVFTAAGLLLAVFLSCFLPNAAQAAITLPSGFFETQVGGDWPGAIGVTFDQNNTMYGWDRSGRVWVFESGSR